MTVLHEDRTLRDRVRVFRDRNDAGKRLVRSLHLYSETDAIVVAVPAGGVPVASEVSHGLHLMLDVIVARKVQVPGETEAGIGAVTADGTLVLNDLLIAALGLDKEAVRKQVAKARESVESREKLFGCCRVRGLEKGRAAILVDDGLASGYTMLAAIRSVKNQGASKVVVAIPTASENALDLLSRDVDEIHCLNVRTGSSFAVADAYLEWRDIPEREAVALLRSSLP
ncbi:MAG TPA: phosphoribosyltransferase family protein [Methanomassiliicoccales archaeon]|nr:phosphoribosyltransferase family protein [Methanomassiliicoccales archaeon]